MNKNTKGLVISALILGLGILLILIGNSLASTESTILKDQVVDSLSFKNASLEYTNNTSTFTVEVTNTSTDTYNLKYIEISFKGSNNEVSKLIGYIGESITSGETRKITASIDKDITDSISLEYSIVK